MVWRRQSGQQIEESRSVAAIGVEWNGSHYPQQRVEYQPETAIGRFLAGSRRRSWRSAIQSADRQIEIPEIAIAGIALLDARLCLIGRVGADSKERALSVVEQVGPRHHRGNGFSGCLIRRRSKKTEDEVLPGGRVDSVVGVVGVTLMKPGNWIAAGEVRRIHSCRRETMSWSCGAVQLLRGMITGKRFNA